MTLGKQKKKIVFYKIVIVTVNLRFTKQLQENKIFPAKG